MSLDRLQEEKRCGSSSSSFVQQNPTGRGNQGHSYHDEPTVYHAGPHLVKIETSFRRNLPDGRSEQINQPLSSSQPRKRALLDDNKARDIFLLRGRVRASDRSTGESSSLFTARSIVVSQVGPIRLFNSICSPQIRCV
jgi:hypothetical protein